MFTKKKMLNSLSGEKNVWLTGFPIALSYPHFYKSDPSLLQAVEGLKPEQEKHESYFYIQPKSGLPVDLAFRFQINMALQDISSIANVERFANFVLPLLWFEIVSITFINSTITYVQIAPYINNKYAMLTRKILQKRVFHNERIKNRHLEAVNSRIIT